MTAQRPSEGASPSHDRTAPLVFFDLDDTLSDRTGAFRRWAADFLERHHITGTEELEWMTELDDGGYLPRDLFFSRVNERFALGEHVSDLVQDYLDTAHASYRYQPELVQQLGGLVLLGIRIGVVTNGGAGQDEKIDAIGIRPLLSACVVSGNVDIRKPDPRIFHLAVEVAGGADGVMPWMVGDHPPNDIVGATAAGFSTIWISLGRPWPNDLQPPTMSCATIAEAFDVLPLLVDA